MRNFQSCYMLARRINFISTLNSSCIAVFSQQYHYSINLSPKQFPVQETSQRSYNRVNNFETQFHAVKRL